MTDERPTPETDAIHPTSWLEMRDPNAHPYHWGIAIRRRALDQGTTEMYQAWAECQLVRKERDETMLRLANQDDEMIAVQRERDALLAKMEWLETWIFERKWDGTIGRASYWDIASNWRHIVKHMRGENLREAIDAAKEQQP